jgi:hypothetical protein
MIVTDRRSPRTALADALGGTLLGTDSILVGAHVIWCSLAGVVRVDSTPIGRWSDGVEALAAAYRTAVESS